MTRHTAQSPRTNALSGSHVLVTGASSGIGRELARQLATAGASLAVVARRSSLLEELADEVVSSGGARPVVIACDLAERGAAFAAAEDALGRLGHVDLLVNNAGDGAVGDQLTLGDGDRARAVFETNLWSPIAFTAALVPGMLARRRGTIVNITSTVQSVPLPLVGYYSASRAALAAATKALRHELAGTAIRVIEAVPGATDTALRDVDTLPWRTAPPQTLPPKSPAQVAAAIIDGLSGPNDRIVHPAYAIVPLELPAVGRLIASAAARRMRAPHPVAAASTGRQER